MVTLKVKKIDSVQALDKDGIVKDRIIVLMIGETDDLDYKLTISAPKVSDLDRANIPTVPREERTLELTEVNHSLSDFVPAESSDKVKQTPTKYENGVLKV
jgi:hypothetical protein